MSDYETEYVKDKRIACKYGVKCYQKNPIHHEKYKHPPKNNLATNTRKRKLSDEPENSNKKEKIRKSPDLKIEEEKDIESDSNNDTPETSKNKNEKEGIGKEYAENMEKCDLDEGTLENLPDSFDVKEFIKNKFLVEMPPDFYQFWDFCRELNPQHPERALKDAGLELVGPFDVLAGKFNGIKDKPDWKYLCHWRYYYDPPELQTVIKGDDKNGYHIGYFRDDPKQLPSLVVSNYAAKDGILNKIGDNIFTAVCIYLEELKNKCDPFKKLSIEKILHRFKKKAESLGLNLDKTTPKTRARQQKSVTQTLNKVGLVVPYNKKTQLGYRSLAVDNNSLEKLLNNLQKAIPEDRNKFLADLQPVLNYATIAIDECDFGTGIELGWDIIAHGVDSLNATALRYLKQCYELLERHEFAKIAEAHLNNRKRNNYNLSIL